MESDKLGGYVTVTIKSLFYTPLKSSQISLQKEFFLVFFVDPFDRAIKK